MRILRNTITVTSALLCLLSIAGCQREQAVDVTRDSLPIIINSDEEQFVFIEQAVKPALETESVAGDSDDPAIWINQENPSASLILGTDKGESDDNLPGSLYAFNLQGKIVKRVTVNVGDRPNNVDIEYGLQAGSEKIDIAIMTLRDARKIRVFRLPDLTPIDGGSGIDVFEGQPDSLRRAMGVSIYKRPSDGAVLPIISRKSGPSGAYLWQYQLTVGDNGQAELRKVRTFGLWSGYPGEIEAIVVDDQLGYVYCSDELLGIRKYHADPQHPDEQRQLAIFGIEKFDSDREGLSLYALDDSTGYIIASDQQANRFQIFPRQGTNGNPHEHPRLKIFTASTLFSDGSDVTSATLNDQFRGGLFVAMSERERNFQFYAWRDIAGEHLEIRQP